VIWIRLSSSALPRLVLDIGARGKDKVSNRVDLRTSNKSKFAAMGNDAASRARGTQGVPSTRACLDESDSLR